ncbi:hypothetical protein BU23DRAFT_524804 [Bimuria novae-zelandiae CBS 107.79]|uniref:Uncharacterized protein n=1 Tax=Bimuria novae-zelandiae CBS 107.79 TaxID=1447943 RepID=A0A6A5VR88_9PLEO|nr:hypothetical protein BU23DRAFT_524804 [Bimuria novae-zelandiae CBS 107.79]
MLCVYLRYLKECGFLYTQEGHQILILQKDTSSSLKKRPKGVSTSFVKVRRLRMGLQNTSRIYYSKYGMRSLLMRSGSLLRRCQIAAKGL